MFLRKGSQRPPSRWIFHLTLRAGIRFITWIPMARSTSWGRSRSQVPDEDSSHRRSSRPFGTGGIVQELRKFVHALSGGRRLPGTRSFSLSPGRRGKHPNLRGLRVIGPPTRRAPAPWAEHISGRRSEIKTGNWSPERAQSAKQKGRCDCSDPEGPLRMSHGFW